MVSYSSILIIFLIFVQAPTSFGSTELLESEFRLNIYNAHNRRRWDMNIKLLQYDCLYYQRIKGFIGFKFSSTWTSDVMTYCFRPEYPNTTFTNDYLDVPLHVQNNYTFVQLKETNISSSQLLDWSAPIDLIESYQSYLDGESDNYRINSTIRTEDEYIFYNCTPPKFGPRCQYFFSQSPMSLTEYVHIAFYYHFASYPPAPTCYTHLKCIYNLKSLCLDWREICDGKWDCIDGVDEEQCWKMEANQCAADEYRCHNGQCVPIEFWNDDEHHPDCMDRTDELGLVGYGRSCFKEPDFRCEDTSCYPLGDTILPFVCGDGQCINQYDRCSNKRHQYAQFPPMLLPVAGMTADCFRAIACLTGMTIRPEACFCKLNAIYSCASIAKTECPKGFFLFTATPVTLRHIYLIYTTDRINPQSQFIEPSHVCFNRSLCSLMNASVSYILGHTCIDYKKEFKATIPSYIGWYKMLDIILKYALTACPSPVIECPHPSLYQCLHSTKCISLSRFFDGLVECPLGDDELHIESCSLNLTNISYFKCDDGLHLSPIRLNDLIINCLGGEDEMDPNQRYTQNNIVFQLICDGVQHMLPIEINGRNETDETDCEQWKCNNSYTHCDSTWNCLNGEDELECKNNSINCSPFEHACITPNTLELTCLSITKVNDGNMDCMGGSDERQLCRSMHPMHHTRRYHCWNRSECADIEGLSSCFTERDKQLSAIVGHPSRCQSKNLTSLLRHICALSDMRNFSFLEHSVSHVGSISTSEHTTKRRSTQSHSIAKVRREESDTIECHRGVVIFVQTKNELVKTCLCSPSSYGDRCEFQNQRVSLTVQARSASDWRSMFTFIFLLMTDENEIESYDYRLYNPSTDCAIKWNIYLLYGSRPKNRSKNYSVRIYAYKREATMVIYRASWHYPIKFYFLPVYRLAVRITIPSQSTAASENVCSLDCNGHGSCIVVNRNTRNKRFLCRCEPGWFGIQCQQAQYPPTVCYCASGSLCISSYSASICVCPLGRDGPRCYIKRDPCRGLDECLNGGQCIPNDERTYSLDTRRCACTNKFQGEHCELPLNQLTLTFHPTITVPSLVLLHMIQRKQGSHHQQSILFKKIFPYENSAIIHTTINKFDLTLTEFHNNYYLMFPKTNHLNKTTIHVYPENRCQSVIEISNSSFAELHLLRRIKYYQIPCKENVDLSCFYDEVHICICDYERQTICILFNHKKTYVCQDDSGNCENEGECFQDDSECPTMSICRCRDCFYGSKCQFSSKGFSLSLDNILGYQIRPSRNLQDQLSIIKVGLFIVIIMFFIGILNGVLSIMTFARKKSRTVGCGLYLLATSVTSILTIILFTLKYLLLMLAQMTYITDRAFLSVQCVSVDFLLRTSINYGDWLNACVAIERTLTVIQSISFNKNKSKLIAKWTIVLLIVIITITNVHDPVSRELITDEDEHRTWCIVRYSFFLEKYNSAAQIFHFSLPFAVNIISALIIIINTARTRSRVQKKQTFKKHIRQQFAANKHLFISSIILILLAIPRLIISLISGCMTSERDPLIPLLGYFISFIPSFLVFAVFVLPSETYKNECKKILIKFYRRLSR